MHWLLHTAKLLPGATLKPEYSDISSKVTAVIDFAGGNLKGGAPLGTGGYYVWDLIPDSIPGYKQAFTDRVLCECETVGPLNISVENARGDQLGAIAVKQPADVWLINEGPKVMEPPTLHDLSALFEAFDSLPANTSQINPKPSPWKKPMPSMKWDTGYCIGVYVE